MYDPTEICKATQAQVCRGNLRKYYRIARGGKWYGGIATSDCCGCQLRCIFCWSGKPRDHPEAVGKFYTPQAVFHALARCAKKHKYRKLRISGNEPTLAKELKAQGAYIAPSTDVKFYCVSCAVHRGVVKVRSELDRRNTGRLR